MARRSHVQSTVPAGKPPKRPKRPLPPKPAVPPRHPQIPHPPPRREVASIIDPQEASLVDVIDNLLNRGVVLNADVILALANVDLVYLRLSALLCAADRVLPAAR
jgi:hypothetical protein